MGVPESKPSFKSYRPGGRPLLVRSPGASTDVNLYEPLESPPVTCSRWLKDVPTVAVRTGRLSVSDGQARSSSSSMHGRRSGRRRVVLPARACPCLHSSVRCFTVVVKVIVVLLPVPGQWCRQIHVGRAGRSRTADPDHANTWASVGDDPQHVVEVREIPRVERARVSERADLHAYGHNVVVRVDVRRGDARRVDDQGDHLAGGRVVAQGSPAPGDSGRYQPGGSDSSCGKISVVS